MALIGGEWSAVRSPAGAKILLFSAAVSPKKKKTPWPLVRERTIPTDRPLLVDEI
jgi:hypothetical protein